jgi:hypothetical protein
MFRENISPPYPGQKIRHAIKQSKTGSKQYLADSSNLKIEAYTPSK